MLDPKHLQIHERALKAAQNYQSAEAGVIETLIEVERERVFVELECSSLFVYSVQYLKLTTAVAYNAIAVARKSREVPALQAEIIKGTIGISTARKIVSVINKDNQSEWLDKAMNLTCRKLEKEVARENPKEAVPEKATYVNGSRLSLTLGLDEELMLKFRRAQDHESRSLRKGASLEETLSAALDIYLKHKDPVEKVKRVIAKKGTHQLLSKSLKTQFTRTVRTPIPAHIKHPVRLRDQDQCQHPKPGGGICGERRWIDLHHIQPISQGGTHSVDNLITLCKTHHQRLHHHE